MAKTRYLFAEFIDALVHFLHGILLPSFSFAASVLVSPTTAEAPDLASLAVQWADCSRKSAPAFISSPVLTVYFFAQLSFALIWCDCASA